MERQTLRKTYKYKLDPTPIQEGKLARVLGLCRYPYNTALEQRIIAYRRAGISLPRRVPRVRGHLLPYLARRAGAQVFVFAFLLKAV
jgi:transposase